MLTSLKGKCVIVTGGSKGIGRGIAQVFARTGSRVTLASRGNAALFFASDEAGYITGQKIVVDGGQILPESVEAIGEI